MLNLSFSQPLAAGCSVCALAGVATLAAGLYLRRGGYGQRSVSARGAASIMALVAGVMLATAWWFGLHEVEGTVAAPPPGAAVARLDGSSSPPPNEALSIEIGAELPSLKVDGWLNGTTPTLQQLAGKVIVVDIWNEL